MTDTRHPNLQRFLSGLQEAMGMGDQTAKMLLEGSDHPYQCRCAICLEWWASMGPEYADGTTPTWGPFSAKEIREYKAGETDVHDQ